MPEVIAVGDLPPWVRAWVQLGWAELPKTWVVLVRKDADDGAWYVTTAKTMERCERLAALGWRQPLY